MTTKYFLVYLVAICAVAAYPVCLPVAAIALYTMRKV